MTAQRTAPLVQRTAAVAALVLTAVGVASAPAWAARSTVVPCPTSATVKLPGETAIADAPVHHGAPSLTVSPVKSAVASAGTVSYSLRLTETNRTGAAYQHVTPVLGFFTQLGVMNPANSKILWQHGGQLVALPTQGGCDPSVWLNSAALDGPLADGQSVSYDFVITTPTAVAEKVKSLSVFAAAGADGDISPSSNDLTLPGWSAADQPTQPTHPSAPSSTKAAAASGSARTAPVATPTAVAAAPLAATVPAPAVPAAASATPHATSTPTGAPSLAFTGGGSNSGPLAVAALALLAGGAAVLFGLKRRSTRR